MGRQDHILVRQGLTTFGEGSIFGPNFGQPWADHFWKGILGHILVRHGLATFGRRILGPHFGQAWADTYLMLVRDLLTDMAGPRLLRLGPRSLPEIDVREGLADGDSWPDRFCALSIDLIVLEIDARQRLAHGYGWAECYCSCRTEIVAREIDFREGLAHGYGRTECFCSFRTETVGREIDFREGL